MMTEGELEAEVMVYNLKTYNKHYNNPIIGFVKTPYPAKNQKLGGKTLPNKKSRISVVGLFRDVWRRLCLVKKGKGIR
jgi:hypothetical protein